MPEYSIRTKVDQIVTKEVVLLIEADNEEEAHKKAVEVLQTYPAAHEVVGVHKAITSKTNHWIPRDISIEECTRA